MSVLDFNGWKSLNESASYISSINDIDVIAATIIGEAGAEPDEGMIAIKNVLRNRAKLKGTSLAGEALRPKQFSMWNSATKGVKVRSDYDASKIKSVIDKYKSHPKWNRAIQIASASVNDITKGANYYYASGGDNKINPPSWTKDWTVTKTIGNHTFGKLV